MGGGPPIGEGVFGTYPYLWGGVGALSADSALRDKSDYMLRVVICRLPRESARPHGGDL